MNAPDFVLPRIPTFRLDIATNPDFTAKGYGKKLLALGGKYSACRGYGTLCRYLTIPNTPEGRVFAADVATVFGGGINKSVTIVLHQYEGQHHNANVGYVNRGEDAAKAIDRIFATFERACRAWWETTGRHLAESEVARTRAQRAAALEAVPETIRAEVRRALDLGASEETIRGAFEVALLAYAKGKVAA